MNSVLFVNKYGMENYIWTALVTLSVVWAFFSSLSGRNRISLWTRINKIGFFVLLIISSILALRSDSIFNDPSQYHWSYLTGVIQTIHSGGELLWSVPSQYGFLNVLLPSLLPWTSRNSFFIFQAVLFIICTFIFVKMAYMSFKHTAAFVLISLAGLSLFYFADPSLVGPTPYPSSSAVRFFNVYILIYAILLEYRKGNILNRGIKWIVAAAYVFGALWSAESFLYCTAIYAAYLLTSVISISKLKAKNNSAFRFLLTNTLIIFIAMVAFNIFYLIITRHIPDWSMYFMYASGYVKGFGELAIKPGEVYWAIIIALSGIVFVLSRLYVKKSYGEWIVCSVCFTALWALTSYYVGRAISNNLTALLPEIFFIFIVLLLVLKDSKFLTYRTLLNAVFLPWIVVGVIGGIGNPQFIDKLRQFKYMENIDGRSFKQNKDLNVILKSLKVAEGKRVVYYWDLYASPVLPDNKGGFVDPLAGMPIPLALLEEPVPENKRDIIMERFLKKIKEPVFLIHKTDEKIDKFIAWKKFFIQKYFIEEEKLGSKEYEVFRVSTNKLRD